jgi:hypothetical protein
MKKISALFLSLLILGCTKTDELEMSDCIGKAVEQYKTLNLQKEFTGVTEYEYDGELYYDFDYGSAFDAPRYLLSNQCDTICRFEFKKGNGTKPCKIEDFYSKATLKKVIVD